MTDPVLRHAGSASNAQGPSSYGNRQGTLKLWTCPGCAASKESKVIQK